jgi:hypothetical protein
MKLEQKTEEIKKEGKEGRRLTSSLKIRLWTYIDFSSVSHKKYRTI